MIARTARLLLALAPALCSATALGAQSFAQVPPLLRLPGSTRALGLGNAFVAGDGPEMLFYNPAQIGVSRGTALSVQAFGSHAILGSMATSTTLLGASVAAGAQYLEYGTRRWNGGTGPNDLARGGRYEASSVMGQLSAAIERRGVRIGFSAKYIQQQFPSGRSSMPAIDLGFATDVKGVTLGLAVLDGGGVIGGTGPSPIHLPTRISAGGMITDIQIGTWFDIGGSASVTVEEGGQFYPAGGVEVTYVPVSGWSFVGRMGAHRVPSTRSRSGESPFSVGATLGVDRLAVDYAFEPYRGPGATHRIGVRIRP